MRDAPSSSLLSQLSWLLNANSWAFTGGPVDQEQPPDAGVWPVGNGRIFAAAGPATPGNRLTGITGPSYAAAPDGGAGGAFGDCWLELSSERGDVGLPFQEIWRPRETGVLVTRAHDRAVSLLAVDYAPPGRPVLLRLVEVWGGDRLGHGARLVVRLPRGEIHDARRRSLRVAAPGRVLIVSALAPGRRAYPGRIDVPLADVASGGGVQRVVLLLVAGTDEDDALGTLPQLLHPVTLLEQTRAFWRIWLGRTHTPDLWPQNLPGPTSTTRSLADLIELGKIGLKMQQAQPKGAVGTMARPGAARIDEANGPVRGLLAIGAREEAQDLLEYQYRGAVALGRIPDAVPLDLDVVGAAELSDWSPVPAPRTDTAAAIVLQHRWWLEAGGNGDLVRRHWAYLRRCVTGQRTDPEGQPPASADEPYAALSALYPDRCGWPNGLVAAAPESGYTPWRFETLASYVAALEAMVWMAEQIADHAEETAGYLAEAQRVRSAVEKLFWQEELGYYAPAIYPLSLAPHQSPFAPANLLPLWLRYHDPAEERARRNVEAVVDLVGFQGSTPDCEHALGVTPAYLLWDLVMVGSDLAPLALAHLAALASAAGEWADLYVPGAPGLAARLRPIETGASLEAIYRYFALRDAAHEPEYEFRGVTRGGKTFGPGPIRRFRMQAARAPHRVVVVTADAAELAAARRAAHLREQDPATVIEPGLPFGADYLAQLLFDSASGERRVDQLILGHSAVAGDRRSMKPAAFWQLPEILGALERFEKSGGRLVRPG